MVLLCLFLWELHQSDLKICYLYQMNTPQVQASKFIICEVKDQLKMIPIEVQSNKNSLLTSSFCSKLLWENGLNPIRLESNIKEKLIMRVVRNGTHHQLRQTKCKSCELPNQNMNWHIRLMPGYIYIYHRNSQETYGICCVQQWDTQNQLCSRWLLS